jgi:hypothetical protein
MTGGNVTIPPTLHRFPACKLLNLARGRHGKGVKMNEHKIRRRQALVNKRKRLKGRLLTAAAIMGVCVAVKAMQTYIVTLIAAF